MNQDPVDDEALRRVWGETAGRAESSANCPSDGEIWNASRGALPPPRMLEVLEHSAGCAACRESWRVAREMQMAVSAAQAPGVAPARSRGLHRVLFGVGLAAAAVIALALFTPLGREMWSESPGDRFREAGGAAIVSLLDETLPLPRQAFVLRWQGGPPGTIYTLSLAREDLTTIELARELESGEHRVPPSALEGLPSGTVLLWRVEALLPDTTRLSSPVFRAILE